MNILNYLLTDLLISRANIKRSGFDNVAMPVLALARDIEMFFPLTLCVFVLHKCRCPGVSAW